MDKINDSIKQYDEVRWAAVGQGNDYITGRLLDYAYFKDNYKLITVDLSKQKILHADPRAIMVQEVAGVKLKLCTAKRKNFVSIIVPLTKGLNCFLCNS